MHLLDLLLELKLKISHYWPRSGKDDGSDSRNRSMQIVTGKQRNDCLQMKQSDLQLSTLTGTHFNNTCEAHVSDAGTKTSTFLRAVFKPSSLGTPHCNVHSYRALLIFLSGHVNQAPALTRIYTCQF
jgi:hypothetical protein